MAAGTKGLPCVALLEGWEKRKKGPVIKKLML